MTFMKFMLRAALVAPALLALPSIALACPVPELVALSKAPLAKLKKTEFDVEEQDSAEGGRWQVYARPDGSVHSILRTDFGETGKAISRASFLNAKTFAITVTTERYAAPIGTPGPVKVASRTTKTFLVCDDKLLGPDGKSGNAEWLKDAQEARGTLAAKELAPHLKKIRP